MMTTRNPPASSKRIVNVSLELDCNGGKTVSFAYDETSVCGSLAKLVEVLSARHGVIKHMSIISDVDVVFPPPAVFTEQIAELTKKTPLYPTVVAQLEVDVQFSLEKPNTQALQDCESSAAGVAAILECLHVMVAQVVYDQIRWTGFDVNTFDTTFETLSALYSLLAKRCMDMNRNFRPHVLYDIELQLELAKDEMFVAYDYLNKRRGDVNDRYDSILKQLQNAVHVLHLINDTAHLLNDDTQRTCNRRPPPIYITCAKWAAGVKAHYSSLSTVN